jgi:hypothetical protein
MFYQTQVPSFLLRKVYVIGNDILYPVKISYKEKGRVKTEELYIGHIKT